MSDTDSLQHLTTFISSLSPNALPPLDSVLSSDGQTATLNGITYSAEVKHNVILRNEKTLNCSLASLIILLLLGDPSSVSYVVYRKTCVDHGVKDPIKVVDRTAVWGTFFREDEKQITAAAASPMDEEEGEEKPSQLLQGIHESQEDRMTQESDNVMMDSQDSKKRKDRTDKKKRDGDDTTHNKHRKESDKKENRKSHESSTRHPSSSSKMDEAAKKSKKDKGPMTQEDLLKNLKTVVDKRESQSEVVGHVRNDTTSGMSQEGHSSQPEEKSSSQDPYNRKGLILEDEYPSQKGLSISSLHSSKEDEYQIIKVWLSSQGFGAEDIPKDILDKDRIEVEKIMSLEIPVGTSATILQCGMGVSTHLSSEGLGKSGALQVGGGGTSQKKKDFSMVLDMYNDMIKVDDKQKRHPSSTSSSRLSLGTSSMALGIHQPKPRPKVLGKPIIIVPNAMTSPITLINASLFFEKSTYQSRDTLVKQDPSARQPSGMVPISRRISPRLGGGLVSYEIIDNPTMKLSKDDWDRVVAVIAQGASWQFKGWKMRGTTNTTNGSSSDISPVDVFSRCYGFYIGFEGSPLPQEVMGWNVKKGMLSKDKRGMDSVVAASFWHGLDEWMSVHKPEYVPLEES